MSCQKIVTLLSFFEFMANLEQSESQIRDAWSVVLTISLKYPFFLQKLKPKLKKL